MMAPFLSSKFVSASKFLVLRNEQRENRAERNWKKHQKSLLKITQNPVMVSKTLIYWKSLLLLIPTVYTLCKKPETKTGKKKKKTTGHKIYKMSVWAFEPSVSLVLFQASKDKPSTKRVLGSTPAPTTTASAGKTSPSSSSTPFTASLPRKSRTWEVPNHSTPGRRSKTLWAVSEFQRQKKMLGPGGNVFTPWGQNNKLHLGTCAFFDETVWLIEPQVTCW